MIQIVLQCNECSVTCEPFDASPIDRYEYHDAPTDGVAIHNYPRGWHISPDGYYQNLNLLALCPENNAQSNQDKYSNFRRTK